MTKVRFLETITPLGYDVLIPIDSIIFILNAVSNTGSYMIKIKTDNGEYEEYFDKDSDKCLLRYNMIKELLYAK
jgi:hypothetical protein